MFEYAINLLDKKVKEIQMYIASRSGSTSFYPEQFTNDKIVELQKAILILEREGEE